MAAEFDELAEAVGDYQRALREYVQVEQQIQAELPPPPPRRRRVHPLLLVAALMLVVPALVVTRAKFVPAPGCVGVQVNPGDDLQALITANGTGTTFCLRAGTHRVTASGGLTPKTGDVFIGVGQNAIVTGSKTVTGWTASGSNWFATGFLPGSPGPDVGTCAAATPLCNQPHDVFFDGVWLAPVASQGALATGKVYLDYSTNRIYLRDNPAGHAVEQSWASHLFTGTGDDVQIKNLITEHAASQANSGALEPGSGASGWVLDHDEIRWNHGIGTGPGSAGSMRITSNNVHHNGQDGTAADGPGGLVQGNDVHNNSYAGFDVLWDGGNKFGSTNLTVTGNYYHDEIGVGIWCDIDCDNITISNNYVKNTQRGIMLEISCDASIHDNIIVDSNDVMTNTWGGIGIIIASSEGVEVYNNQIYNGNRGIWAIQQDRGTGVCTGGTEHVVKNLNVHNNQVDLNDAAPPFGGKVGLWTDTGRTDLYTTLNNQFQNNTYYDTTPNSNWDWGMSSPPYTSLISFAAWQAASNDTSGGGVVNSDPTPPAAPTLVVGPQP